MSFICITILVWIYLYMWNIAINNFKFNNRYKIQTIILTILFLPIEIVSLCFILSVGIVLGILSIILLPIKNNPFYKLFKGYMSVIKNEINDYSECIKVINILNDTNKNTNYYNVPNINLLANYLVSVLKCDVNIDTFEKIMSDFINKYNNGVSVLRWIEQDNFLNEE